MELIEINHPAVVTRHSYFPLFKDVSSYDELMHKISKIQDNDLEHIKGDLFELYTMWLIKFVSKGKNRILPFKNIRAAAAGQKGYDFLADIDNDVLFAGENPEDRTVFLQMKYRSSYKFPLPIEMDKHGLERLVAEHGNKPFRFNDKSRCYLVTNADMQDNYLATEYFKEPEKRDRVNFIGGVELRSVLDTNKAYFENFYNSLVFSYERIMTQQKLSKINLYSIQKENMKNLNNITFCSDGFYKSVFIAPPGIGKTEIEKAGTIRCLESLHKRGRGGYIVIVSPTIALTLQHFKSFYKNISFNDNNIGIACCTGIDNKESGNTKEDEKNVSELAKLISIENASNPESVRKMVKKFDANKPSIIFSTYKSMNTVFDILVGKNPREIFSKSVKKNGEESIKEGELINFNIPRDDSGITDRIEMVIFDEAHKLITASGAYFYSVKSLIDCDKISAAAYFTATPKISSNEFEPNYYTPEAIENGTVEWSDDHNKISFSNRYVFGDKMDVIDYNEAKDKGFICETRIDFINYQGTFLKNKEKFDNFEAFLTKTASKSLGKNQYGMILGAGGKVKYKGIADGTGKNIIDIDLKHVAGIIAALESNVKKINQFKKKNIKGRIIVFCESVSEAMAYKEIINLLRESNFWEDRKDHWKAEVVHSGIVKERDHIINEVFGEKTLEKKVESGEASWDDLYNTVVFHYDTLSEGIDVPAVTGVLIDRDMSNDPITLRQGIGRGGRITVNDRERFITYSEDNETVETLITRDGDTPETMQKIRNLLSIKSEWEKPYNWIMAIDDKINQVTTFLNMIQNCGVTVGFQDVEYSGGSDYDPEARLSTENHEKIMMGSEENRFIGDEKEAYASYDIVSNRIEEITCNDDLW